jgi:hypothetical protein
MPRHSSSWEADVAEGIVGMAFVATVILIGVVLTLLYLMLMELWRIFQARAMDGTTTARNLWQALACLIGAWVLAAVVAAATQQGIYALLLAAWSFLLFVLACEYLDRQAGSKEPEPPKELTLADVASWPSTPAAIHAAAEVPV